MIMAAIARRKKAIGGHSTHFCFVVSFVVSRLLYPRLGLSFQEVRRMNIGLLYLAKSEIIMDTYIETPESASVYFG